MVTLSAALLAFLDSGPPPFWGAELYTITLTNGTVLRITSFDQDIKYPTSGGNTFTSKGPYVNRSKLSIGVGLKSSTLEMKLIANPTVMLNGTPILQAIAQGALTNATVNVRRAFMTQGDIQQSPVICNLTGAATGTGDGTICRFAGWVGKIIEVTPLSATVEFRDAMYYFNRPAPKNCYQPGCWHTLFDQGCTLLPTDTSPATGQPYIQTGTVQSGSTTLTVNTTLPQDAANAPAPTVQPTLAAYQYGPNQNLPWIGYYVTYTWVTIYGETVASPEASLGIPATGIHTAQVCQVTVPTPPAGAIGWNLYVGDGSGNEQLQNPVPYSTSALTQLTSEAGPLASGILPPGIPTTGYWALGTITFTSGALIGQSFSVAASASGGALTMAVPLPVAPSAGDGFSIIPGCDKTYPTCQNKFGTGGPGVGNLINFTGCPSIPTPENGS